MRNIQNGQLLWVFVVGLLRAFEGGTLKGGTLKGGTLESQVAFSGSNAIATEHRATFSASDSFVYEVTKT
jgi:hypothetical protein